MRQSSASQEPSYQTMTEGYRSLLVDNEEANRGPLPGLEACFNTSIRPLEKEAAAQSMDSAGKGVLHSSSVFFGPALLQLATHAACDGEDCSAEDRIYGIRPSSLLTVANVIATMLAAICLPFLGALVDRSHHRRLAGASTAYILIAINFAQIFLSSGTWPFFWILHIISDSCNMIHHVIILAYLQNLTGDLNLLSRYTSSFAAIQFLVMTIYILSITVYAQGTTSDIVVISRLAHVLSFVFGSVTLTYAWTNLFGERPPLLRTPSTPIWERIQQIRRDNPPLMWLLVTVLWSPYVGSGSYFAIFSTLQKSLVEMTSPQIGIANLLTLLSTLAGTRLSNFCCYRWNALRSFQLCLSTMALTFAGTSLLVHGPGQVHLYYFFSCGLGVTMGWYLPTERVLFCALAPSGVEVMGVLLSVHASTSWIPPFLFSVVNEAGYSLGWALASEIFLFSIALLCSSRIAMPQKVESSSSVLREEPPSASESNQFV